MDRRTDREPMDRQTDDPITRCPLATFQDWGIKRVMDWTQCEPMEEKKGSFSSPKLCLWGKNLFVGSMKNYIDI